MECPVRHMILLCSWTCLENWSVLVQHPLKTKGNCIFSIHLRNYRVPADRQLPPLFLSLFVPVFGLWKQYSFSLYHLQISYIYSLLSIPFKLWWNPWNPLLYISSGHFQSSSCAGVPRPWRDVRFWDAHDRDSGAGKLLLVDRAETKASWDTPWCVE